MQSEPTNLAVHISSASGVPGNRVAMAERNGDCPGKERSADGSRLGVISEERTCKPAEDSAPKGEAARLSRVQSLTSSAYACAMMESPGFFSIVWMRR